MGPISTSVSLIGSSSFGTGCGGDAVAWGRPPFGDDDMLGRANLRGVIPFG